MPIPLLYSAWSPNQKNKQEKETRYSIWEIKFFFLHTNAKSIHLRDPKDCTRKIVKFINPIIKVIRYKTEHTEIITFFYNSKIARKKFEKIPPHNSLQNT